MKIFNANTIDSALANTTISANAVPTPEAFCAPLKNIATQLRPVGIARTGTIQGPWQISTSAIGTNPTNFQSGNGAFDNVAITVNYLSKRGHFRNLESGLGLTTEGHSEESMKRDMEKDLWALAMLVYQGATYGATDVVSAAADFDTTDLENLAKINTGNPRTALVASGALPGIANDLVRENGKWVYPGLSGGIYECLLTGSTADVAIVAGPTSLAFVNEKPVYFQVPPGEISFTEVILPRLQIPVWRCEWFAKSSRERWVSFDTLFGIAPAELTAMTYSATS